jgi:hypothetical protein
MVSECSFPSSSDSNAQWKNVAEHHLRRQFDSYNAEDGSVELPAVETGHAIKTLLFLIEAAQW